MEERAQRIHVKDSFEREIVLELFRCGVRDNIGAAPSRYQALGAIFQEVMARTDFENRTVVAGDYDAGSISDGVVSLVCIAIEFGMYLRSQGFELDPEYFLPVDQ